MLEKARTRPDLLLLLSLLLVILVHPLLDRGDVRRLFLGALMFVPVITATVRLATSKGRAWPSVLLMLAILVFSAASTFVPNRAIAGTRWGLLAVFFGLTVVKLFSYLKNSSSVSESHLYTAVSIYLLLGLQWFALYSAVDTFDPGAIRHSDATQTDQATELLYFSLVTLTTIGYGDVTPVGGEVRMLAALEGITGVLYVAITVAILVGAYKNPNRPG
jgi:hypothetical protein